MKTRALFILHAPPPKHGAAMVGDYIINSPVINDNLSCKFIKIRSSDAIDEIGKIRLIKFYHYIALYFEVLFAILIFRPAVIYYTPSTGRIAFYRDVMLSTLWKAYAYIAPIQVYYHYHTKGVDALVSSSLIDRVLMRFFVKGENLILLSQEFVSDFVKVSARSKFHILPNGVEDPFSKREIQPVLSRRSNEKEPINILFLSNMIREKGYFDVLSLAIKTYESPIVFHFAGAWGSGEEEKDFHEFVLNNKLSKKVIFHGFISGDKKNDLFERAHLFIFPTRYHKEAFPLAILESFAYGVPVVSTNEGAISSMIDSQTGIVIDDLNKLEACFFSALDTMTNIDTYMRCRSRYESNYTLEIFENRLLEIIK